MEQSTCSKFCKVSGRVLPNEITKYFLCHLSGHTNRTKKKDYTPQEKQRNRPTKKMGRYCTAFMSFKQNRNDGFARCRIFFIIILVPYPFVDAFVILGIHWKFDGFPYLSKCARKLVIY